MKARLFFSPQYVQDHWQKDQPLTHRFLNGVNPVLIQGCSARPAHPPVTSSVVFPGGESTLEDELQVMTDTCF